MENVLFIFRLLAVGYLAIGLGMLISPDYYKDRFQGMVKSPGFTLGASLIALCFGFSIVNYFNSWKGWEALITLVGWIALIKGVAFLLFPKKMLDFSMQLISKKNFPAYGAATLLVGLIFGYFGFFYL